MDAKVAHSSSTCSVVGAVPCQDSPALIGTPFASHLLNNCIVLDALSTQRHEHFMTSIGRQLRANSICVSVSAHMGACAWERMWERAHGSERAIELLEGSGLLILLVRPRFPCPMRHVSRWRSICAQFYARSHALICARSKTAFSAPHSISSPHLAQTERVRLTRFFALPDSNTSPRVTISVLGHVVVSQMGIVQVPYATLTVKYFRTLTYIWAQMCVHALARVLTAHVLRTANDMQRDSPRSATCRLSLR